MGNVATNVVFDLELIMYFEGNLLKLTIYHVISLFELTLHASLSNLHYRK